MKLLLVTDIDYTLFFPDEKEVTWIGGRQSWINLFKALSAKAKNNGIEVIFAIVSAKEKFDDLAAHAAITFLTLLNNQHTQMFSQLDSQPYVLVKYSDKIRYESIIEDKAIDLDPKTLKVPTSHFHIVVNGTDSEIAQGKLKAILEIAAFHVIENEDVLFLDDKRSTVDAAAAARIKTVSFECFAPKEPTVKPSNEFIKRNLEQLQNEIRENMDAILVNMMLRQKPELLFVSSNDGPPSVLRPTLEETKATNHSFKP